MCSDHLKPGSGYARPCRLGAAVWGALILLSVSGCTWFANPPEIPGDPYAYPEGQGITVVWEDASGAASYRVFVKTPGTTGFTQAGEVTGTVWTHENPGKAGVYTYRIQAAGPGGVSDLSTEITVNHFTLAAPVLDAGYFPAQLDSSSAGTVELTVEYPEPDPDEDLVIRLYYAKGTPDDLSAYLPYGTAPLYYTDLGSSKTITVRGLTPMTQYSFYAEAYLRDYEYIDTDAVPYRTSAPGNVIGRTAPASGTLPAGVSVWYSFEAEADERYTLECVNSSIRPFYVFAVTGDGAVPVNDTLRDGSDGFISEDIDAVGTVFIRLRLEADEVTAPGSYVFRVTDSGGAEVPVSFVNDPTGEGEFDVE